MGYDSDYYTTRRTYSRPIVTSYTYTMPIRYTSSTMSTFPVRYPTSKSTVYSYTTTYPIYSSVPYVVHKHLLPVPRTILPTTRLLTTPSVRVVTSPVRFVRSPVRVIRSPVRVVHSPVRVFRTSPVRTVLRTSPVRVTYSPVRILRTPVRVITSPPRVISLRPSILNKELHRIENKNFDEETRSIRTSTHTMLRALQPTTVHRRSRSTTPFVVTSATEKYHKHYDSIDDLTLGMNKLYYHPEPYTKHDTSVKFIGKKGYTTRNSLCDLDKVRTDVEFLSHYRKNRFAAKEKLARVPPLESDWPYTTRRYSDYDYY